ncbi:MAG TPA: WXG100 family type VII secretion target [Herpetosiphonaceae bacterium]
MAAPIVQADYPALEEIAARFQRRAEAALELRDSLRRACDPLRRGSWRGDAATAFFAEFEGDVLPAAERLIGALEEIGAATLRVGAIMQAAEEEAAALFGGDPLGGGEQDDKHKQQAAAPEMGLPEQAVKYGVQFLNDALNVATGRVFEIEQLAASGDLRGALDLARESGSYNQAIKLAVKLAGIDASGAAAIRFDPTLPNEADTSPELVVSVGKSAFVSSEWLISSLKHELVHVRQGREGRWYNGPQGTALNEVEAYAVELAEAKASGMDPVMQTAIENRGIHYYNELDATNRGRADASSYTLPAAEKED